MIQGSHNHSLTHSELVLAFISVPLSFTKDFFLFFSSHKSLMAYCCRALIFTTFMAFSCMIVMGDNLPSSTISAAPALLPDPISPSSSSSPPPSLSPEIYPVFPSPGGPQLAPTDSSAPLIPSSPSPPNPDEFAAEGPGAAFPPMRMLPDSSSQGRRVEVFLSSAAVLCAGLWMNQGF